MVHLEGVVAYHPVQWLVKTGPKLNQYFLVPHKDVQWVFPSAETGVWLQAPVVP